MLYNKKENSRKKLGRFFENIADRFSIDIMDLIWAVEKNDVEKVRRAMQAGLDPNQTDGIERLALPRAIDQLNEEMIGLLLQGGADPNLQGKDGETALYKAVTWGHEPIVKMLLDAGANANLPIKAGVTPMQEARNRGNESMIQLLENPQRTTPKQKDIAKPKKRKKYTSTATQQQKENTQRSIEIAKKTEIAAKKITEAVNKTTQAIKDAANEVIGEQQTAKEIAKKEKKTSSSKVSPNKTTSTPTPPQPSPKKKAAEAIPYIKETGSITGALIMAIQKKNESAIKALLHQIKPVDLNKVDEHTGLTPLYAAIEQKDPDATGMLIDKGADTLQVIPSKQHSPLSLAVIMKSLNLVKFIVEKNDPLRLIEALNKGEQLLSPQFLAYNQPKILDILLGAGADPNFGGKEGPSPLLKGMEKGSIGLLPLYVKHALDLNQIVEGKSLLEWAIHYNREDWVNGLITEGALTNVKNENNQTPLEYAKTFGDKRDAIVRILETVSK